MLSGHKCNEEKKQDKDKRTPRAGDVTLDGVIRGGLSDPRRYFSRDMMEECDKVKPFLSGGRGNSAEAAKCSFKEEPAVAERSEPGERA